MGPGGGDRAGAAASRSGLTPGPRRLIRLLAALSLRAGARVSIFCFFRRRIGEASRRDRGGLPRQTTSDMAPRRGRRVGSNGAAGERRRLDSGSVATFGGAVNCDRFESVVAARRPCVDRAPRCATRLRGSRSTGGDGSPAGACGERTPRRAGDWLAPRCRPWQAGRGDGHAGQVAVPRELRPVGASAGMKKKGRRWASGRARSRERRLRRPVVGRRIQGFRNFRRGPFPLDGVSVAPRSAEASARSAFIQAQFAFQRRNGAAWRFFVFPCRRRHYTPPLPHHVWRTPLRVCGVERGT